MASCIKTHPNCAPLSSSDVPLPTRVLYLGLSQGKDRIRLCEFLSGHRGQYAALSHCWGGKQTLTLAEERSVKGT
ncbi:hypothetical protein CONLIGDRAFT_628052 [Coniochaeta ligniaria NRRL 30616]|uniref:Heterokaryon incompatibility domain-containing protein n=1 Tax=Coniochaeta ligniaria NRRL 30616 TaxID=1408157 RepID=A0A1J7IZE7_9PEZI|nr:hypothetical protein CONLIGDRAFT_628052 [Coniochaeta ligniaria NRRL 30616]